MWATVRASNGTEVQGEHLDAARRVSVQLTETGQRLRSQALMAARPAFHKRVLFAQRFFQGQ